MSGVGRVVRIRDGDVVLRDLAEDDLPQRLVGVLELTGCRVMRAKDLPEADEGGPRCPICGAEGALDHHEGMELRVCLPCRTAADKIEAQFERDLATHRREFHAQLEQQVRDYRTTGEFPSFYRGFEGGTGA